MKHTNEEFFNILLKYIHEIGEFEMKLREAARRGELFSQNTEMFAEFVRKFPEKDREVAYTILFMIGVDIAKPKTVFEDMAAARGGKKPKDPKDGKN